MGVRCDASVKGKQINEMDDLLSFYCFVALWSDPGTQMRCYKFFLITDIDFRYFRKV
jgi:hypothetical protein